MYSALNFIEAEGGGFDAYDVADAVLGKYVAQYCPIDGKGDAEAVAALPKAVEARNLMARNVENDRREIATAEASEALLQDAAAPEAIQPADEEAARAKVTALRAERKAVDDRVQAVLYAKQAAVEATERAQNATPYYREVQAWQAGDTPVDMPQERFAVCSGTSAARSRLPNVCFKSCTRRLANPGCGAAPRIFFHCAAARFLALR